jgi:undecaprenyl-diphosphatase
MLELLDQIDKTVFVWLNSGLANPLFDLVMPVVTSDDLLRLLYGLAMVAVLWKGDARLRWLILFSGLTLALSDQLAANYLKHAIERPRPCHVLENVNLLVGCGGGYALPSAHAANSFGQAFLWSLAVRQVTWQLYAFAALVAISRVFVGVHYLFDILAGAAVGALAGWILYRLFLVFEQRVIRRRKERYAIPNRSSPGRPD